MNAPHSPNSETPTALERLRDLETEYASQRANYDILANQYLRGIEYLDSKIAAVREAIRLEEETPQLPALQLPLANLAHPAPSGLEAPARRSQSVARARALSRAWLAFVEDRLHKVGPTTFDALYAEAPSEIRCGFESIEARTSPTFRARRLLRQSTIFEVDRNDSVVTMSASAAPHLPPFSEKDAIIRSLRYDFSAQQTHVILDQQGTAVSLSFREFFIKLSNGYKAWMRAPDGSLQPIGIKRLMSNRSTISSYDETDWNDTFAKAANSARFSKVPVARKNQMVPA